MKKFWLIICTFLWYTFYSFPVHAQTASTIINIGKSLQRNLQSELCIENIETIEDVIAQADLLENALKKDSYNVRVWRNLDNAYTQLHVYLIEKLRKYRPVTISNAEWEHFEQIAELFFFFEPPSESKSFFQSIWDGSKYFVDRYIQTIFPRATKPFQYVLASMYLRFFQLILEEKVSEKAINQITVSFKNQLEKTLTNNAELMHQAFEKEISEQDIEEFLVVLSKYAQTFEEPFHWPVATIIKTTLFGLGLTASIAVSVFTYNKISKAERSISKTKKKFTQQLSNAFFEGDKAIVPQTKNLLTKLTNLADGADQNKIRETLDNLHVTSKTTKETISTLNQLITAIKKTINGYTLARGFLWNKINFASKQLQKNVAEYDSDSDDKYFDYAEDFEDLD